MKGILRRGAFGKLLPRWNLKSAIRNPQSKMLAVACRTGSTQPYLVEVPPPRPPEAGEVFCRTLELGICGTDREILHSANPWTPPGDDYLVLGHECLARVEQVGSGVSEYHAGDLV